ncbi:FAD-binding domain-containing protein [Hyaloscypha variabilis F]|uniref:FAD-binding domain-containing protein n=1 Tax=Hyaloscypha variabilis (strain UAMH 11265 / GT02V1 / F) TaxID=1149755 RepID=A0A2J6R010_HYAVF|nr:FAD-binding domain-containing protein [Hyaloscypha variabilis F]
MLSNLSLAGCLLAAAVTSAQNLTIANLTAGANCACTQLASTYGGQVLTSNSTNYTAEATDYWDIRADLLPGCIFSPANADEVAAAVSTFTSCGAQFAIRGGGHMNFPGSNNIDGGVLLSLGSLTDIKIASDNKTVDAGPGTRWIDVYTALSEYGLYCIGGRLKTIGVPGLELIGGFHYLINKYGMAMDNVLSYDVVLGNGTQVVANSTSNPDLFWALKGGGNNFGIVTKFTIKALPIPYISTTIQEFNESVMPDFIAATVNMAENDPPDVAAGSVISVTYNQTTKSISPSLLGVQEGTESPPSRFANFSAIPSVLSLNYVLTPLEWHSQLDSPFQMFRVQFAHRTIKPDTAQLLKIYESWKTAVDEISDVEGLVPTFVMNILPKSALSVAKNNGIGNTWGLDDDQSYILWQFSTGWANAADDLRMTNWASKLLDYWHLENQALNLASEFIYMGDAGDFQDPFTGFPVENVRKMREIRDAYDPLGVFTRLNWGGFKLGAN